MTTAPAPSPLAVQLVLTPRMRSAFTHCQQHLDDAQLATPEFQALAAVFRAAALAPAAPVTPALAADGSPIPASFTAPVPPATISFVQVQLLSRLFRSTMPADASSTSASAPTASSAAASSDSTSPPATSDTSTALDADPSSPGSGFVHELVRGSSVQALAPARSSRRQDPAFKRYLEEQRWKQDRREYARMVADLPGNRLAAQREAAEDGSLGSSYASATRDVGHGLNILTLMVTGFVVFYYAGCGLFPHNHIFAVLTGLLGLIGALMCEVCLFLVREEKSERGEAQQKKMAASEKKAAAIAEMKRARAKQVEIERRAVMLQQQQKQAVKADQAQEIKLD